MLCGTPCRSTTWSRRTPSEPRQSREAGEALSRDAVRSVLVCEDGALVGVVTRKTLVREVVANGRDPESTTLGEIAEEPNATIDAGMALDDAFAFLEEHDYERVPVVEDGKLVGILSRSGVQRRLKIGYNRAARLIEVMEQQGIVTPPETNGNRTVLAPPPPSD